MERAQVLSLMGQLRPHTSHGMAKRRDRFFFFKSINLGNKFSSLIFCPHTIVTLEQTSSFPAYRACYLGMLCCVQLFATPWTVAHWAPLSMGFPSQEYWSGLPFPSPGDLPNPGIKPKSPALQAEALTSEPDI